MGRKKKVEETQEIKNEVDQAADETKVNAIVEEKKEVEPAYYTVGRLKFALQDLADDAPVVAAPINDNIKVSLDLSVVKDAQLGEYHGDVAIFSTGLFDIATGNAINLVIQKND